MRTELDICDCSADYVCELCEQDDLIRRILGELEEEPEHDTDPHPAIKEEGKGR